MSFFDRFWVSQSEIPPNEILIIFLMLHILLVFFLILVYSSIKSRMIRSAKGFDIDEQLEISNSLMVSLNRIFLGLLLIIIDNILTHSIAIFYRKDAYFSVGSSSFLIIIGFSLFIIHITKFLTEALRVPKSINSKFLSFIKNMKYIYVSFFVGIIALQTLTIPIRAISLVFILSTGLIGLFFTIEFILIFKIQLTDPVNQLRILLGGLLGFGMVIFLLFSINFIPPLNQPSENWPTRDARVEILIFGTDLWVLYTCFMLATLVLLPRNVRLLFGISDEEFDLYRDERFDLDWNRKYLYSSVKKANHTNNEIDQIVFVDPNLKSLKLKWGWLNQKENSFMFNLEEFVDPYIDTYLKDRSDIVLIILETTDEISDVFEFIKDYYEFNLQIKEFLQVNDFIYKLENYSCSMIVGIPSFWNNAYKLWLILGNKENMGKTIELFEMYNSFFNSIADDEQLFVVTKFPVVNGKIQGIPSFDSDPETPDFRHLIFL